MKLPPVYPILDTESLDRCAISLATAAAAFLEGGAGILQIRHKGHWSRDIFDAARTVARLCRENGTQLIVDDRADIALLLEAGLHVGQDDLTPRDARKVNGSDALLGYSSHNMAQLQSFNRSIGGLQSRPGGEGARGGFSGGWGGSHSGGSSGGSNHGGSGGGGSSHGGGGGGGASSGGSGGGHR